MIFDGSGRNERHYRRGCYARYMTTCLWHVRRVSAIEAVYTYEGTDSVQSLIVGRAITGISAFI